LYVFVDSRFFTNVLGVDSSATNFANDDGDAHGLNAKVNLISSTATDLTIGLDNYVAYKVETVGNEIYNYSASNTEEIYSVIGGPRGIFGAVSLVVKSGLDAEYTLYGTTNNSTLHYTAQQTIAHYCQERLSTILILQFMSKVLLLLLKCRFLSELSELPKILE
jgi:hypothetical protein